MSFFVRPRRFAPDPTLSSCARRHPRPSLRARPSHPSPSPPRPKTNKHTLNSITTCRAALDAGEAALRSGDAAAALALFERALDLPGSAAVRLAGRPLEVSVPSDGEASACLYNMACCYAALGQVDAGITVLGAALESPGSLDRRELAAGVAGDPDLEPLRGAPGYAALARAAAAAAAGGGAEDGGSAAAGPGGPLGLLAGVFGGGGKGKKDGGVLDRMLRPW